MANKLPSKNVAQKKTDALKPKSSRKRGVTKIRDERIEALFTIVDRSKAEYYLDLLQSFDVNMQTVLLAHGTADAKTLEYIGLASSDKALILSMVRADRIADIMNTLDSKFRTIKNGKGIAYTVPLTGIIGTLIYGFLSDNRRTVKEPKETAEK